jgi:hypothetical protein
MSALNYRLAAIEARLNLLESGSPRGCDSELADEVKTLIKIMPMGNNEVEASRARLYRLVYPDAGPECCHDTEIASKRL